MKKEVAQHHLTEAVVMSVLKEEEKIGRPTNAGSVRELFKSTNPFSFRRLKVYPSNRHFSYTLNLKYMK